MRKKWVWLLVVLLVLPVMTGCSPDAGQDNGLPDHEEPPVSEEPADPQEPQPPETEEPQVNEFSLIGPEGVLILRAWDDQLRHEDFLGEPDDLHLAEAENADTFNGSWVRTETYPGMTLVWFSPKEDGQRFWLMSAQTTDPRYRTVRDIGVGSTREEMEAAYPDIQQTLDGRTDPDNCAYHWGEQPGIYEQGLFEVKDGVIRQIDLDHIMP